MTVEEEVDAIIQFLERERIIGPFTRSSDRDGKVVVAI